MVSLLSFAEKERVVDFPSQLLSVSAERLLYLIRLGHPNEYNEPFTRYDVISAIQYRGFILLDELGWKHEADTIYKNRYTGDETKLSEYLHKSVREYRHNNPTGSDELPFLMENWTELRFWTDDKLFDEYNPKKGQTRLIL